MRSKAFFFLFLFMVLVVSHLIRDPVWAQQATGSIAGTIRDETGGVIPGVTVTAQHVATAIERQVTSGDTGYYIFPVLAIGEYTVTVSLPGFKTTVRTGIRVVSASTLTVDLVLPVGEVTETITVSGQPPLVNTTDTIVAHTQSAERLEVLPLHMRGFFRQARDFLRTMPGVMHGSGNNDWGANKGIVHGVGDSGPHRQAVGQNTDGHQSAIGWTQGLRDDAGPQPELVQEFRLETNQNAEHGFTVGVGMELITKSGTNQFHGSIYEYHRNNVLDARNFFARDVGPQKQNEFGFILGGPIIKNRLFFMMSYEGFRWRVAPRGRLATVATDKMRAGDFSELLGPVLGTDALGREVRVGQIYNPFTTRPDGQGGFIRDPYPNNIIPPELISSVTKQIMTAYPAPTRPGLSQNWEGSFQTFYNLDRTYLKIDSEHGDHKFTVGWEDTPDFKLNFGGSVVAGQPVIVDNRQYRFRINHTWTVRPNLLFSSRAGINRVTYGEKKPEEVGNLCPGGCVKGALSPDLPRIAIQSAVAGGFSDHVNRAENFQGTVPLMADLSWIKGNHNTKFGAQLSIYASRQVSEVFTAGSYTFRNRGTGLPGFPTTGDGFSSFLLGEVDEALQWTPRAMKISSYSWAFYAQDSWRATPRLNINYGLRWELPIPVHESYQRWGAFSPTVPNPAAGGRPGAIWFWGEGPGRNGLTRMAHIGYRSWSPRLGLAYEVDDKTVVRAYYGVVYYPAAMDQAGGNTVPFLGFGAQSTRRTPDEGLTPALNWEQGINILPPVPNLDPSLFNGNAVGFIDPNETKQGRASRLGFALEREIPGNMVVRAEYVGLLGHGIYTSQIARYNQLPLQFLGLGNLLLEDINSPAARQAGIPIPYEGFQGTVGQALRPFPQFDWVPQLNSKSGYSLYHSGLFTLERRFSEGLSFLLSHTISKTLMSGDVRERGSFEPRQGLAQQHWGLWKSSKTLAPYDLSWYTKAAFRYDLPFGPGKRFGGNATGFLKQLVGGWTVAGSLNYNAGPPLLAGTGQFLPYMGPAWVNREAGVPIPTGISCGDLDPNVEGRNRIFNVNAFSVPDDFELGDTRVVPNARHCGWANEDISILKDFFVREGMYVRFGAEFFNAFNRVNWREAGSSVDSPAAFGRIGGATDPRTIQFYLKIGF